MKITIIFVLLLLLFGCVETKEESKKHTSTNTFCKKINTEEVIENYFDTTIISIENIDMDYAIAGQLEASLNITRVDSSHQDYDVRTWVEALNSQIYCVLFDVRRKVVNGEYDNFVESCENNLCERCQSYLFFYGQKIYFSTFTTSPAPDHYCMNWNTRNGSFVKITLCNQKQYIFWSFGRLRSAESTSPRKDIIISLDSQKIDISREIYSYPLER